MYHRKYFCKHSANARQYVSGKGGVVAAGIGNVKGSSTLRLPLRLDYNCGQDRILQGRRAHYEGAQAHRYFYNTR